MPDNSVFCFCFTEASKVIMQYVAEVSGKGRDIDRVKEQLLQSNPVLEGITNSNEPPLGKTNNVVSEQVQHKSGCTVTEAG